jgi:hypothetical protein
MSTPPPIPPVIGPIATITYDLTRGDLFVNSLTVLFRNRILQVIVFGMLLFNGCVVVMPKVGKIPTGQLWFEVAFWFILMIGIFVALQLFVALALAFVQKQQGVVGQHTLEITEQGLVERTAFNDTLHKWPSICRICSQFGYVFIYVSDTNSHQVPVRRVNEGQLEFFLTALRARTQN